MNDTPVKIEDRLRQMMSARSGSERLEMGCSMFDMSKKIVEASILAEKPDIGFDEMQIQLFLRIYKNDFDEKEQQRIIEHFRRTFSNPKTLKASGALRY